MSRHLAIKTLFVLNKSLAREQRTSIWQVYNMAAPTAAVPQMVHMCESKECGSEAKMKCPTCIKLGIDGSWFCSQVRYCFMLI